MLHVLENDLSVCLYHIGGFMSLLIGMLVELGLLTRLGRRRFQRSTRRSDDLGGTLQHDMLDLLLIQACWIDIRRMY